MSNTYSLYDAVTTFQKKQQEAYNAYIKAMKAVETAKGSQYYEEQKKAAMGKRKAAEDEARETARYWVNKALEDMMTANKTRKAVPLTADQLSILQAMKLRTSISEAELDQIANAMEGNAMGLGVVQDFARDMIRKQEGQSLRHPYGIAKNYLSLAKDSYPIEEMNRELKNIATACSRIIESDGANRARGLAAMAHSRMYGGDLDRDSLEREAIPENEAAFYDRVSRVPVDILQKCLNND